MKLELPEQLFQGLKNQEISLARSLRSLKPPRRKEKGSELSGFAPLRELFF